MLIQAGKWLSVFLISMLKFAFAPLSATAMGLNPFSTILVCVIGMMTSVLVFSFFGDWFKLNIIDRFRKPILFTSKNRQIVSLWKKFGIKGVAFLTPIFLTPIGGTIIATSFGESRKNIYISMLISSIFWAVTLTTIYRFFGAQILNFHL